MEMQWKYFASGFQTFDVIRDKLNVQVDDWPYSQGRFIHWSPEWRPGHPDFSLKERARKFDNAPAGMPGHADVLQNEVAKHLNPEVLYILGFAPYFRVPGLKSAMPVKSRLAYAHLLQISVVRDVGFWCF